MASRPGPPREITCKSCHFSSASGGIRAPTDCGFSWRLPPSRMNGVFVCAPTRNDFHPNQYPFPFQSVAVRVRSEPLAPVYLLSPQPFGDWLKGARRAGGRVEGRTQFTHLAGGSGGRGISLQCSCRNPAALRARPAAIRYDWMQSSGRKRENAPSGKALWAAEMASPPSGSERKGRVLQNLYSRVRFSPAPLAP